MVLLRVTLEIAKALKQVGFPQDNLDHAWETHLFGAIANPTADEIADALPPFDGNDPLTIQRLGVGDFKAYYQTTWMAYGHTMAEALALLYIKLKEAK